MSHSDLSQSGTNIEKRAGGTNKQMKHSSIVLLAFTLNPLDLVTFSFRPLYTCRWVPAEFDFIAKKTSANREV